MDYLINKYFVMLVIEVSNLTLILISLFSSILLKNQIKSCNHLNFHNTKIICLKADLLFILIGDMNIVKKKSLTYFA